MRFGEIVNRMGICLESDDDSTIDIYFHGDGAMETMETHGFLPHYPWKKGWARCGLGVIMGSHSHS